jgi:hypothetical protein
VKKSGIIRIENADMSNDKGGIEPTPPKVEGFLRNVRQRRVKRPLRSTSESSDRWVFDEDFKV